MVEKLQDLALILSGQALVSRHLLHWDLLQDDKGPVAAPSAQVDNPARGGKGDIRLTKVSLMKWVGH